MTEKKIRDLIGSGDVWTQQFCIPVESEKIINNNKTTTRQKEMAVLQESWVASDSQSPTDEAIPAIWPLWHGPALLECRLGPEVESPTS